MPKLSARLLGHISALQNRTREDLKHEKRAKLRLFLLGRQNALTDIVAWLEWNVGEGE